MIRILGIALAFLIPFQIALAGPIRPAEFHKKPKLVLVLVVDQMRADYLTRFHPRFLPAKSPGGAVGGYEFLTSNGAYFPFAEYDTLQCMTGPGHAMILSGSYPYQMGIPLNSWFDEKTNSPVYCVQDPAQSIVGSSAKLGMSPKNFLGDTVGDELKNAGYPSRVVGVALKDRAAILLGGHRADLALWLDPSAFRWVSSSYYLPEGKLPPWVDALNRDLDARKGQTYTWKSSKPLTGLTMGKEFSHTEMIGTKYSIVLPLGLELTEAAAEKAMDSLKLGRGKATDLLAVSFSSHDYMGHQYGPNTLEMEDMTVAEDRVISKFLNHVKAALPGGLQDVTIVLTADHGVPPSATWLAQEKIDAGKINGETAIAAIEARLEARFGKAKVPYIPFQSDLNFYISPEALADRKLARKDVEDEARLALSALPGVAHVFTRSDYEARKLPPGMFERGILKSYIPGKSGDVVIIPKPFYQIDEDPVTHLTRYAYDRTVPLVIYSSRVKPGVYSSHADVVDLASTLSFMLGIVAPSASEGRVLNEIF